VSENARACANSICCGIVLANLAISSCSPFEKFAPLPLTVMWLYVGAFACGLVLGITLDDAKQMLYGVGSMALVAVLIFGGALIYIAWSNKATSYDTISLLAFQQSFVRFVFISILGGVGAFCATVLKLVFSGEL